MGDRSLDFSILLELAAFDDLLGFRIAIEQQGNNVDDVGLWYGRRMGSRKMGLEERTPLMVAAMYGSKNVLSYIVATGRVNVNRACGSDGATALHCAAGSGSDSAADIVKILLENSADCNALDSNNKRPSALIAYGFKSLSGFRKRKLESLLNHESGIEEGLHIHEFEGQRKQKNSVGLFKEERKKQEYPINVSLPDMNNEIFVTDEFRMYSFKIKPCSRAYSHDWMECPFAHPGENAKRRDPRKFQYSCVPCPDFRKGSCSKGENCEFSHGIFESWLHPAQYRTRLCKDGVSCTRKVCFFAHKAQELRPLYASTGSAIPPQSYSSGTSSLDMGSMNPLHHSSPLHVIPSRASYQIGETTRRKQSAISPPSNRLKTSNSIRNMSSDNDFYGEEHSNNFDGTFSFLRSMDATQSNLPSPVGTRIGQNANQQHVRSYRDNFSNSTMNAPLSFAVDPSGSSIYARRPSRGIPELCLAASHNFESLEASGLDEPDISWVQALLSDASSEFLRKVGSEQMVA